MNNISKKGSSGLSAIDFFMLGFGSMIGVGWTVSLNDWFYTAGGVLGTVLAFLIGTLMVIPIGLCYGEMTGSMPVSGGTMAFAYRAEGSRLSFLGGWLTSLAYIVLLPWEMIYINHILGLLFPFFTKGTPLYVIFGFEVYLGSLLFGIALTFAMILLNVKGTALAGKMQTKLTIGILVAALIIIFFGFMKANPDNLRPIYMPIESQGHKTFFGGFISILVIVPFFLAGFDAIPQAIEDANDDIDPKKIPKIIVFTIAAAGLFYILIILSAATAVHWTDFVQLESPALAFLFSWVYDGALSKFLYYVVMIGALGGLLSTYNGMFIAASKLLYSMGRSKLLPDAFSITTIHGTPVVAILFCGLATLIGPFFGTSVIAPLTNVGSLSFVLGWLITSYSTLKLRRFEGTLKRPIKAGEDYTVILISIAVSSLLVILSIIPSSPGFMTYPSLGIFIVWLILGVIFYKISQNRGEQVSEIERFELMFEKDE